ncbi:MAG: site-specific DNA-methyltransferase [Elusimicrobia bacterium]|nr:site-specific DNA-methyltransferase [Elusimicrobiota bacterium]
MRKIKLYRIINADAQKYIKKIPSRSVDLILTDPPYNLSPYSTGNIKFTWRKDFNNDLAGWDKKSFIPANWINEFKRILKPTGNIFAFCSYNLIGKWHAVFDPEFDTFQFMVWHKTNPPPKVRRAGFLNSCELIVCVWNKGHTWNFTKQNEMHNFIETPICMGRERTKNPVHPTQKPVRVLKHIIKIASNPNDLVFDPFMGVGSTGVASVEMRRRFLGVEIDKKYFNKAKMRLKTAQVSSLSDEFEIQVGKNLSVYNKGKIFKREGFRMAKQK